MRANVLRMNTKSRLRQVRARYCKCAQKIVLQSFTSNVTHHNILIIVVFPFSEKLNFNCKYTLRATFFSLQILI